MENQNLNTHHLLLGEIEDFLTGNNIPDTHDERYRQKLAKHLVNHCGFKKQEILKNHPLTLLVDDKKARLTVDLLAEVKGRTCMLINFAPGSIVTRLRCTLALSRIIRPYQIPVVVITNGEDAEVLDGFTGLTLGKGLGAIPPRNGMEELTGHRYKEMTEKQIMLESRIAYAFIVDGSCPCDDDICIL